MEHFVIHWHSWLSPRCKHDQAVIDNFGIQVGTRGQTARRNPTRSHTEFVIQIAGGLHLICLTRLGGYKGSQKVTRPNPSEKVSTVAPNQSKKRGQVHRRPLEIFDSLCDGPGLVLEYVWVTEPKFLTFWVKWCTAASEALAYKGHFANVMRILLKYSIVDRYEWYVCHYERQKSHIIE